MPIEAEKLDTEELLAYFRETLFVQGSIASGSRRRAAEDCMTTIEKRLRAPAPATLPAGVTVIARTVEGTPYPALERPDGTALTREEAAAFLTSFISDFAIVARIPGVEIVALLDAEGVAYDALTGEQLPDTRPTGDGEPAPGPVAEEAPPAEKAKAKQKGGAT